MGPVRVPVCPFCSLPRFPLEWLENDRTLTTSSHKSNSSSLWQCKMWSSLLWVPPITCLNMSALEVEVSQSSSAPAPPALLSIMDIKFRLEWRLKSTELGLQCLSILQLNFWVELVVIKPNEYCFLMFIKPFFKFSVAQHCYCFFCNSLWSFEWIYNLNQWIGEIRCEWMHKEKKIPVLFIKLQFRSISFRMIKMLIIEFLKVNKF